MSTPDDFGARRDRFATETGDRTPVIATDDGPHGPRWWTEERVYAMHEPFDILISVPRKPPPEALL